MLKSINDSPADLEFYEACAIDDLEAAKAAIAEGASNFHLGIYNACYSGSLQIAKYLIEEHKTISFNYGLKAACCNKQIKLVKYLIEEHGADDFNWGLMQVISNGDIETIKYLYKHIDRCLANNIPFSPLTAYEVDNALHAACMYNNVDVIKYLVEERKADSFRLGLFYAKVHRSKKAIYCMLKYITYHSYTIDRRYLNDISDEVLKELVNMDLTSKMGLFMGVDMPIRFDIFGERYAKIVQDRNKINCMIKEVLLNNTELYDVIIDLVCSYTEY